MALWKSSNKKQGLSMLLRSNYIKKMAAALSFAVLLSVGFVSSSKALPAGVLADNVKIKIQEVVRPPIPR